MSELHSLVHLDLCCEPEEDLAPSYGVPYTVHRDPGRFTCVLPAVDLGILDTTDNEVHDVRPRKKGPVGTHVLLGLCVAVGRQTSTAPSPLATTQNIPIRTNT